MDIYEKKSRWKIYLAAAAFLVVIASMMYTNYIAERLAEGERDKVDLFAAALARLNGDTNPNTAASTDDSLLDADVSEEVLLNSEDLQADVSMDFKILETLIKDIPVILVDEYGEIYEAMNLDGADWEKELAKIKASGGLPIKGEGYASEIYYKNTFLLTLLTYFPLFQLGLLLTFIGIGYLGFSAARRAEQNQVWVGMAKETAHQLGTPISAIVAWLEHLKLMKGEDEDTMEIVGELENDVSRLNLVADRFSKIGSEPKLEPINVYHELEQCRAYMQRRASRRVAFEFPLPDHTPLNVNINPPLFDWVIENLLRNALDAMDGKGKIAAKVSEDKDFVIINISDTGSGIPPSKFKTVFQPGFTTKKRGWGLGLSLAKRIIENYHSGKIFVKSSILNEGTIFTIKLPKA